MSDRELLARKLLSAYVDELEVHVAALNEGLLAFERGGAPAGNDELLHALFRTIHTIKGSSRAAGATLVEQTSHRFENVLARLREHRLAPSPALFELLFAVTDAIAESGERLRRGEPDSGGALDALSVRLETVTGDTETAGQARADVSLAPTNTAAAPATLRIDPERIDAIIAQTSELIATQGRLRERADELADLQRGLASALRGRATTTGTDERPQREARLLASLERVLASFREDQRRLALDIATVDASARGLRMVAFGEIVPGLERLVRDVSAAANKRVELVVEGLDVQVDRAVLGGLRPALLHLVRNAIDHGLEPGDARAAAGKGEVGRVRIGARHRGAEIVVTVEDDGAGVDLDSVRAQLARRGLAVPARDDEVLRSIFGAGFSTARLITDLSGRGVGLDVVKRNIEAMRGTIDLLSRAGRGTTFSLVVPLTLTSLRGLLVRCRKQLFVVPGTAVLRLMRVGKSEVGLVGGVATALFDGAPVAVVSLAEVLGLGEPRDLSTDKVPAIVVVAEGSRVALLVDEVLEERDLLVQSVGRRLAGAAAVSGATVLADGRLALSLNMSEVVQRSRVGLRTSTGARERETTNRKRDILLADDSLTTRTLERSILEAAGYEVRAAGDGEEAFRLLTEHGADLVVSDVEMPLLDGFSLTARIRATPRFRELPVILLTALGSDADKARGLEVGADAYLVKSAFDQENLLETIRQLL